MPNNVSPEKDRSASTRFAFSLLKQLSSVSNGENLFFSPASVLLCLLPLYEGASGETHESMARVLEVVHLDSEERRLQIVSLKAALQDTGTSIQTENAAALCFSKNSPPLPEYVAKVRERYEAEMFVMNFCDPMPLGKINSWVSTKTRGKIPTLVDSVDPLTSVVALNAIYFKDCWKTQFTPGLTRDEVFKASVVSHK